MCMPAAACALHLDEHLWLIDALRNAMQHTANAQTLPRSEKLCSLSAIAGGTLVEDR